MSNRGLHDRRSGAHGLPADCAGGPPQAGENRRRYLSYPQPHCRCAYGNPRSRTGAPHALLLAVSDCDTTEAAMEHIDAAGFNHLYDHLARRTRIEQMLRFTQTPPQCDAIMFSFDNKVLGANRSPEAIARELQC